MRIISSSPSRHAFALPTVLIASVVLLIVLSVSVTATTSARNALKDQYYAQLAQLAGEAGVAFAQACLQANDNTVTWSDVNPLTPATDCTGTENISPDTCPTSDQCWVTVQDNIHSGFSVPAPEVDGNGRPVTIPQTGYVEIWRESTGTVWRTYRQPSAQPAVVPALCSGAARSDLGWANATETTSTGTFVTSTAKPIGIAAGNLAAGPVHYRKDFNITESTTYTIQAKGNDRLTLYLDGAMILQSSADDTTGSIDLTIEPGCHVLHGVVTNAGLAPNASNFMLSLKKQGAAKELVVTDASWRVTGGTVQSFTSNGYYTSSSWTNARDISAYNAGTPWSEPTNWSMITSDTSARWISVNAGYSGTNYPMTSYGYLRSKKTAAWTFSAATEIQFSLSCDDSCTMYVDGSPVLSGSTGVTATTNVTLSAGNHSVGIQLYNGGAADSPSGFLFSARRTSDSVVIDRSDTNWLGATTWFASAQTLQSYDESFHASPDIYDCNCTAQGTTNLVNNPSIEVTTTGYSAVNATQSRSTAADNNGSWGLRLTVNALGTMPRTVYTTSNIEPGQVYTLSSYVLSSVDTRMAYFYKDATGTAIPIGGTTTFYSDFVNPGGVFTRLSVVTQAAPPQAESMEIWVGVADNTPTTTIADIDDLMLSPGPTLPNYGDGSLTNWRWLGTSHSSISSGPAQ